MTEQFKQLAEQLTRDLELTHPPVQVSYTSAPPGGVAEHPGGAPSVCTFFAEGAVHPFFADAPAHDACEIGAFVIGRKPEGELGTRLLGTIGTMVEDGYLGADEPSKIPHNPEAPKYVAYGPLGSLDLPPTTVLLFAKPKSAMLAVEAAGGHVPMNGRPMCAINPILNQGAPVAMSLGCIGSRVYTQMADHELVFGIRGDHLAEFAASVRRIRGANDAVELADRRRREAADRPFKRNRSAR
ncbi:MAG TPA: DUF169 domain-containing protein [Thermoplasmata archaeon]|nr:DUF169 domain-containing protein [Thermoplasmata archaeon]